MIEPALFALIRDGETTLYIDPCGAILFARNLVWGKDAIESWLAGREPVHEFDTDCEAGAVIDFDAMALLWYTEDDLADHPRSIELLDTLIGAAWPGFEIIYADGMADLQIAAGDSISHAVAQRLRAPESDVDPLETRSDTLDEETREDEPFDPNDEDERFAWVTILDDNNSIHHRLIGEITSDVIRNEDDPIGRLLMLEPYDVPAEQNVTEAIIIDQPSRNIRIYGKRNIASIANEIKENWRDWDVQCVTTGGYEQQCKFSGPSGKPMSAAEALGTVVPALLMTERVDPAMVLGEIGKSFKGFMAKLVTGVTMLVCLPFVVFALISGNWKTGGITIGIIVVLVAVGFKLVERKLRRGFAAKMAPLRSDANGDDDNQVVAGPVETGERKRKLDQLLQTAGLPRLAEIEPHFSGGLFGS